MLYFCSTNLECDLPAPPLNSYVILLTSLADCIPFWLQSFCLVTLLHCVLYGYKLLVSDYLIYLCV